MADRASVNALRQERKAGLRDERVMRESATAHAQRGDTAT